VAAILASGRLLRPDGEPAADLVLRLQAFAIEDGWTQVGDARTARDGTFAIEAEGLPGDAPIAPLVRLIGGRGEPLEAEPRPRADGGGLVLDFGDVVRGPAGGRVAIRAADIGRLSIERDDMRGAVRAAELARDELAGRIALRDARIRELEAPGLATARADDPAPPADLGPAAAMEVSRLRLDLLRAETEAVERGARADTLSTRLTAVMAERDDIRAELETLRRGDAPEIGALTAAIAKAVTEARVPGAAVTDARVTLRGTVSGDGRTFRPLDAVELARADGGAASELAFGIRPLSDGAAGGTTMPDTVGLTPASARRALRPLGRRVEVIEAPGRPAGAVIRQVPEAGAELPAGATIRLVVATGPAAEEEG
jgi:hypothetical protein